MRRVDTYIVLLNCALRAALYTLWLGMLGPQDFVEVRCCAGSPELAHWCVASPPAHLLGYAKADAEGDFGRLPAHPLPRLGQRSIPFHSI